MLIRLIAILSISFSLLIVAARAYGEAHPEPDELKALGFDVCDGKPCFMGIVPGVTTWDQAKAILDRRVASGQPVLNVLDELNTDSNGTVIVIVLNLSNTPIFRVADAIAYWRNLCGVRVNGSGAVKEFEMVYP